MHELSMPVVLRYNCLFSSSFISWKELNRNTPVVRTCFGAIDHLPMFSLCKPVASPVCSSLSHGGKYHSLIFLVRSLTGCQVFTVVPSVFNSISSPSLPSSNHVVCDSNLSLLFEKSLVILFSIVVKFIHILFIFHFQHSHLNHAIRSNDFSLLTFGEDDHLKAWMCFL